MANKRRDTRVNKKIRANMNSEKTVLKNISKSGGFIEISAPPPKNPFQLLLQFNKYKSLQLTCNPQWSNEKGLGFKILSIDADEKMKQWFYDYLEERIEFASRWGENRVYRLDIFVTLGHTNVFGNVYFAKYFEFQGMVREKFLSDHVENLQEIMAEKGYRLVTIDAYNKYINSAYFGDTITAELTTRDIMYSQMTAVIRFRNKKNNLLIGEGYQSSCCVSRKGRVIKWPSFLKFIEFYEEVS